MPSSDPIYYVCASFTGVAFAASADQVPDDASIIPAMRVDPSVRVQGQDWLHARRVS